MRPHRRTVTIVAGLTSAIVALSLGVTAPATARGTQLGTTASHQRGQETTPRTLTLVTGDRITVHGDGQLEMTPRPGVKYLEEKVKNRHYLIPSDALPLLKADRLDLRLFDLDGLLAAKYDQRKELPLIVSNTGQSLVAARELKVTRQLKAVKGFAGQVSQGQLGSFWKSLPAGTGKIWLDGLRKPTLDVSVPLIGAPTAWASGLDGAGVKVAVLDTGIDATHPDLAGKVLAEQNFAAEMEDGLDRVGHGTHVASTIAGSGAASGGKYRGVAPGAFLLDGKVCFEGGCAESWILAGMQWAADSGAQVVNMSLGGTDTPEIDPIEQAVNDLTVSAGMLFVIAAGNAGGDETVGSPASADLALAVAASDKTDHMADFSSRGPRTGDLAVKPEITGPGVAITAANSKDGFLGEPGKAYTTLSGTSMATPHVAGSAAILTQQHPDWTPAQRKAALMASAKPLSGVSPFAQGAGRVDVAREITQTVTSSPTAVSFAAQEWPHGDDPVQSRQVTYRNAGSAAVTLSLSLTDSAGGTFAVSPATVTVPAGGEASVTLTADTRGGSTIGALGGQLVAAAGSTQVSTPYGVVREEELFAVDFTRIGRDGAPAEASFGLVIDVDEFKFYTAEGADPHLRLPAGRYFVDTAFFGEDSFTHLVYPLLTVSAPTAVTFDARQAKGIDVTLPDQSVKPLLAATNLNLKLEDSGFSSGVMSDSFEGLYVGQTGPKDVPGVTASGQLISAQLDADGSPRDTPVLYNALFTKNGSYFDGYTKHYRKGDFAQVRSELAKSTTEVMTKLRFAQLDGGSWAVGFPLAVPRRLTEYLASSAPWSEETSEVVQTPDGWYDTVTVWPVEGAQYTAGRTYDQQWGRGVFGPTFPDALGLQRSGDAVYLYPSLWGDAQGRNGYGVYSAARSVLYRNGALVSEKSTPFADFEVPAGSARYRMESSVERRDGFSTRVSTVWEFTSAQTAQRVPLPVSAIGFAPGLNDQNQARRDTLLFVPVTVWQQPGSGAGRVGKVQVRVSTDDGATWHDVPVLSLLGKRYAVVLNPHTAGWVSLRASATDSNGNKVDQTVIHAYPVVS